MSASTAAPWHGFWITLASPAVAVLVYLVGGRAEAGGASQQPVPATRT